MTPTIRCARCGGMRPMPVSLADLTPFLRPVVTRPAAAPNLAAALRAAQQRPTDPRAHLRAIIRRPVPVGGAR